MTHSRGHGPLRETTMSPPLYLKCLTFHKSSTFFSGRFIRPIDLWFTRNVNGDLKLKRHFRQNLRSKKPTFHSKEKTSKYSSTYDFYTRSRFLTLKKTMKITDLRSRVSESLSRTFVSLHEEEARKNFSVKSYYKSF